MTVVALPVLDLQDQNAREHVGLDLGDITDEDWTGCQAVGLAAHFLGVAGVRAPSATGEGLVLTAFESRVGPRQIVVDSSERLTQELYDRIAAPTLPEVEPATG